MNNTIPFQPLTFSLGKHILTTPSLGESYCYMIANGLGGYSSLTAISSCTRHDHGLFMASKVAPTHRMHYVTNLEEAVIINGESFSLDNQTFATKTNSKLHTDYLQNFSFQIIPTWSYQVNGIEIIKEVVMIHEKNALAVRYRIFSHGNCNASFQFTPLYRLTDKDNYPSSIEEFAFNDTSVTNNTTGYTCYSSTNARVIQNNPTIYKDLYFEYDSRDGRDCIGTSVKGACYECNITKKYEEFYILFSDEPFSSTENIDSAYITSLFEQEIVRCKDLIAQSNLSHPVAQTLVLSADQFLSKRDSTKGMTILAGYPFFGDWGRDTMIAMLGCCISTRRFQDAKSILRTFQQYERKGMLPNMFPEKADEEPMYNTVDASLLFIDAIYQLYELDQDLEFVKEMFPTMASIVTWYEHGTDFHIKMCEDGLISAGDELEQLTWMDIRFDDILPTPRHGKPVEIYVGRKFL